MRRLTGFRYLEPTFFSGLLDDPVLWVKIRPLGRSLLFDCGQIHHLAKRVIKSLDAVFISHVHMDHFMGMDTLMRYRHCVPRTLHVYGPPGIATRLYHKLAAYAWNLAESSWGSLHITEIGPEHLTQYHLHGPAGFRLEPVACRPWQKSLIFSNAFCQVHARLLDHKIPVLAFRLQEKPAFAIDQQRLQQQGLAPGPWLRELKKRFYQNRLQEPLEVPCAVPHAGHSKSLTGQALYQAICQQQPPMSLGYITDCGWTCSNRHLLCQLCAHCQLLLCECSYLAEDCHRARRAYHLCTPDLNQLLAWLRPRHILPMHLSKNYQGQSQHLYQQLQPPADTDIIRLPEHRTPAPLLPRDLPRLH